MKPSTAILTALILVLLGCAQESTQWASSRGKVHQIGTWRWVELPPPPPVGLEEFLARAKGATMSWAGEYQLRLRNDQAAKAADYVSAHPDRTRAAASPRPAPPAPCPAPGPA